MTAKNQNYICVTDNPAKPKRFKANAEGAIDDKVIRLTEDFAKARELTCITVFSSVSMPVVIESKLEGHDDPITVQATSADMDDLMGRSLLIAVENPEETESICLALAEHLREKLRGQYNEILVSAGMATSPEPLEA